MAVLQHEKQSLTTYPAFQADETFAQHLQQLLVDLSDLALQGKQAHWNVVGPNFRDLHLQLDEIVDAARAFSDEVAERMRAVYVVPDGSAARVAAQTSLPPFPTGEVDAPVVVEKITASLYGVAATVRRIHDDIDSADPTTADLLHAILDRVEQLAWMVSAERRVAGKGVPAAIVV